MPRKEALGIIHRASPEVQNRSSDHSNVLSRILHVDNIFAVQATACDLLGCSTITRQLSTRRRIVPNTSSEPSITHLRDRRKKRREKGFVPFELWRRPLLVHRRTMESRES
jgi:hypothetical protein